MKTKVFSYIGRIISLMEVFVRHADKKFSNCLIPPDGLDPGILSTNRERSQAIILSFIEEWGPPTIIITSPYLRCRETSVLIRETLSEHNFPLPSLYVEPLLGEYVGNQVKKLKGRNTLSSFLLPETISYVGHIPIFENNYSSFQSRVRNFFYSRGRYGNLSTDNRGRRTWYITHGVFIQEVCRLMGRKIPHPGTLEGVVISP